MFSVSAQSLEYLEFEIGDRDGGVKDDQPLDDLHLNNAINLDYIASLLGYNIPYRIKVPSYLRADYNIAMRRCGTFKKRELILGFQSLTSEVAPILAERITISFKVASEILQTIQRASEVYQLNLPLCKLPKKILEEILIPEIWWTNFNKILNLVNGRAEMRRDASFIKNVPEVDYFGSGCSIVLRGMTKCFKVECFIHTAVISVDGSKREKYIGSFDSLLLMLDTIGQRICLYISNQIALKVQMPGSINPNILNEIILIGDQCINRLGNKGYEVIAMFESVCVGSLLKKNPDEVNDPEMFLSNCIEESRGLLDGPVEQEFANRVICQWIRVLQLMTSQEISNAFCIYRIWGHPTVDIYAGMDKVYKLGTKKKLIMPRTGHTAVLQFRKMFLISFYEKHKTYPRVIFETSNKSYVRSCIEDNNIINVRHPLYSLTQFDDLKLTKIWSVPETYDIFHVLNDKAVSPTRSELVENIEAGRGTQCGQLRRGIWRWMCGESLRCREFLQEINDKGLDEDSKIIGLYEKEREIKITARMFALMSENMRYYFVLTEELIANHIIPYFPEITMKDSLNVLLRKLWTNSKRTEHNRLDVNVNIDFSKWNLNMRDELVNGVFKEIDSLFGYDNLISQTHQIFHDSYIYSASGKYDPVVSNGKLVCEPPMSYTHHSGGFEGLRQKGWTIVTVLLLAETADREKLRISLMGQGDNQVVKLHMPVGRWSSYGLNKEKKTAAAQELCQNYIKEIDVTFKDAHLPIKVRETWRSCNLFMYSKMMTLHNESLPQWYKKVLRSYALSNEGVLTFGGVIGTIATNMSSAAGASSMPDIMYVVFLIFSEWSCTALLNYQPFTRKSYIQSPLRSVNLAVGTKRKTFGFTPASVSELIVTLTLIPTSIGGNITIPMTSFICRGFPDPASEGYAWVKFLLTGSEKYYKVMESWYRFLGNPTIEHDQLIQSPLSLNHWKPPTPGVQSRDVVRDWILTGEFDDNRFIKNVKIIMEPFDRKGICNELVTDPFSPLIANELYNILPHVAVDGVLRRIENTRTVRKMAMSSSDRRPVISKLMEAEENFLAYLGWRIKQRGEIFSGCSTAHTRQVRNIGWNRRIVHITTPHPLELCLGQRCRKMNAACFERDHIYARIQTTGGFAPYLGSRTKVKVHTYQDESARKEPLICSSAKMARYLSWLQLGPNTKAFIEKSVRVVCDIDVFDDFFAEDLAEETFTGSVEHRFHPSSVSDGSFINYSPQVGSTVFLSSDYLPNFGRGKTNYTLAFQPLYVFLQYVAANQSGTSCIHFHLDCTECIVPTEEDVPDIMDQTPHIDHALSEETQDVIRETLGQISKRPELTILEHPILRGVRRDLLTCHAKSVLDSIYVLLGHTLAATLRGHQEKLSGGIGLEDLQTYPRIYAYKLHADVLVDYTCRSMIFQSLLKNSEGINLGSIQRCKRRLIYHLNSLPSSAFKDIGSLCIGRNYRQEDPIHEIIIKSFPETVESFLEGVRSMVISKLETIGSLRVLNERLILPAPALTKRIHLYILMEIASLKGCSAHQNHEELERSISSDYYPDCHNNCIRNLLNKIELTNATLDRAFKILEIAESSPKKVTGQVEVPYFRRSIVTSENGSGVIPQGVIELFMTHYRPIPPICLPTSALYKWEAVASLVQKKNIIVLGDGTGGTSLVFASHHTQSVIYPCALLEKSKCIPQDVDSLKPPLSRRMKNVNHQLHLEIPDDILNPCWKERFYEAIIHMGPENVLVVSDVEGEGGNKLLTHHILSGIPEGTSMILKVYLHEFKEGGFGQSMSDLEILVSHYCNTHYGEVLLKGVKSKGRTFAKEQLLERAIEDTELWIRQVPSSRKDVNNAMKMKYPSIWHYNKQCVISHINYLGISFSEDMLQLKMFELLGMITSYIQRTYHFGKFQGSSDTRKVNPLLKSQMSRALGIIFRGWTTGVSEYELDLLKIHTEDVTMKPIIFLGGSRIRLEKEDRRIISILREMRREKSLKFTEILNMKKFMSDALNFCKHHRTFTWSLLSQAKNAISDEGSDSSRGILI
uniref:Replicase n=1 Tax=Brassica virus 2_Ole TaxID=2977960 RepID=A0A9N6YJB5_9RHAB|nr:TPA_asm: polyprotein [Brassica virus 2_Ole]